MNKIAYITDLHLNETLPIAGIDSKNNWEIILEDVQKRGIKTIVFGGDIGNPSGYKWFFETLKPFSYRLIPGNHDITDQIKKYYWEGTDKYELFYHIEDDNYKYIFLDSSSEVISSKQLNWLKGELVTTKRLIIFIHHPVLAVNTPIDKNYPLKNRDEIKEILHSPPQEINLFCGHYHMEDETLEKNIRQIITPASSYQMQKTAETITPYDSYFGYRIVELKKGSFNTRVIKFQPHK